MQVFIDYGYSDFPIEALSLENFTSPEQIESHICSKINPSTQTPENYQIFLEDSILDNTFTLEDQNFKTLSISYQIVGGKGGFGSLLRNAAARKKHFTNFDAAKDMTGRRLRDIKNEKQQVEWLKKKKQERKYINEEVDKFKIQEKERIARSSFLKIDKSYNDKVQKWVGDINVSVREGLKKRLLRKREENEVFDDSEKMVEFDESWNFGNKKVKGSLRNTNSNKKAKKFMRKKSSQGKDLEKENIVLGDFEETIQENSGQEVVNEECSKANDVQEKQQLEEIVEEVKAEGVLEIAAEIEEARTDEPVYGEICLSEMNAVEDLVGQGLEHLKHELTRLGLKSGGRLEDRAQRQWDIKLNPSLLFNHKYLARKS